MDTQNREQEQMQCIICEKMHSDGIVICSQFICGDCETEMVRTDVKDEKYPFFITQMRRIWYKKDA